jgi:indolepyruvate decarboxylase
MIFVESILDPYDAPAAMIGSSNKGVDLDDGPPCPQQRKNLQLRSATVDVARTQVKEMENTP